MSLLALSDELELGQQQQQQHNDDDDDVSCHVFVTSIETPINTHLE